MRRGGGSFFAAADPAGDRAPFETIGRYMFFHVRRACAPVGGSRKSRFLHCFVYLLVSMGENEAFGAFARWSLPLVQAKRNLRSLKSAASAGDPLISSFKRGRRQLPQAGEVRRPLGPAW